MRNVLDWILGTPTAAPLAGLRVATPAHRGSQDEPRALFDHLHQGPVHGPLLAALRTTAAEAPSRSTRRHFAVRELAPVAWSIEQTIMVGGLLAILLMVVSPFALPTSFGLDLPAVWNASVDLQHQATPEAYAALQDAATSGGWLSSVAGRLGLFIAL